MFKLRYLIFLLFYHSLHALTTLHVSLDSDNNPGGGGEVGDLRYCLNVMNQFLNTSPDYYEIIFDFPMTIQLNGILPIINNSNNLVYITIGNLDPMPTVIIDGNNTYPGFFMPMGNVTIQNMIFQNLCAKGGNGGDGIAGGGGGMGAGGAIYLPQNFLYGSNPNVTLSNVSINSCSAVGGNGGNYSTSASTGDEGGGGGGGFGGNGGSITATGITGGGGGGGFGGNGGDVTLSTDDIDGGGGGGGGGLGSRATIGTITDLGNGGSDADNGQDGSGYGLNITAGSGGGGKTGGNLAGGGGGGGGTPSGGGGGGSLGNDGRIPEGINVPGGASAPSGGSGNDGGGGGGGGIVAISGSSNSINGQAGSGGYGGGGGGGAGNGAYDAGYTVEGGSGGTGGGGGGGGVNQSGSTPANGGFSYGGGGGGGGGPSNGLFSDGGTDYGNLGGGAGGKGADGVGPGYGGGGGGSGSGLGGAIFVDSGLNLTIKAITGTPTTFNTTNNTVQAGIYGSGGGGGTNGTIGSALGNSIFLRTASSLTFTATDTDDLLTLGDGVSFIDDKIFDAGGTIVLVTGNGTVIYNGTSDYLGIITINNANFKVNGLINNASINVCRDKDFSLQRGTLSGSGTIIGSVFVNSGTIAPDTNQTLTLKSLLLNSANPSDNNLGSLVNIEINATGTSVVSLTDTASLAGILEINLDPNTTPGEYIFLTSTGITGTFDSITFTGETPSYTLSYLPVGAPTYVQFNFLGYPPTIQPPSNLTGKQIKNNFGLEYELYNQLAWTPSPSSNVTGYFIYRDSIKIATTGANVASYQDHNQPRGVTTTYTLEAFDSDDNISSPVTVTVIAK